MLCTQQFAVYITLSHCTALPIISEFKNVVNDETFTNIQWAVALVLPFSCYTYWQWYWYW